MGLPEILIEFKTQGLTAIQRSERGIVALILNDDTDTSFDTKTYTSPLEVDPEDWTATNLDYIKKAFEGIPARLIVERLAVAAADDNAAFVRLRDKKWNYIAIPGADASRQSDLATQVKSWRQVDGKTFKAVVSGVTADSEGVINFTASDIQVGERTYTGIEYTARIAGILAGLPLSRSATYYSLPEVDSIAAPDDPGADIDAGELVLIVEDGEAPKIARGVNSLTTTTATKGEEFKKIKIIEGVDMMKDDIRSTFNGSYVGKVINHYDNKVLFLAAVNAYFRELERIDVLDPFAGNLAEIDVVSQRNYLASKGVDVANMDEQQIKEYNTGSKVFIRAAAKFVDAMEDLYFTVYM